MAKSANAIDSKSIVREDLWVQLPPAAPLDPTTWPVCRAIPRDPNACVDERGLGGAYVYLLGVYLGDGMLSLAPRRVWKLRLFQDSRYIELIDKWRMAIDEVSGHTAGLAVGLGCTEVYSNWKHWICLFPQHASGEKHKRRIILEDWQDRLVDRYPREFVAGLIHSDGCRAINRVRRPLKGRTGVYEYPRYFFSNRSADIIELFRSACSRIGVETRLNNWFSVSVARHRSVGILDSFIGPKR